MQSYGVAFRSALSRRRQRRRSRCRRRRNSDGPRPAAERAWDRRGKARRVRRGSGRPRFRVWVAAGRADGRRGSLELPRDGALPSAAAVAPTTIAPTTLAALAPLAPWPRRPAQRVRRSHGRRRTTLSASGHDACGPSWHTRSRSAGERAARPARAPAARGGGWRSRREPQSERSRKAPRLPVARHVALRVPKARASVDRRHTEAETLADLSRRTTVNGLSEQCLTLSRKQPWSASTTAGVWPAPARVATDDSSAAPVGRRRRLRPKHLSTRSARSRATRPARSSASPRPEELDAHSSRKVVCATSSASARLPTA